MPTSTLPARGATVRERTADDLDAVVAIAEEIRERDGYPSFLGDSTLRQFVDPEDALGAWVAERDGDVVGNVVLRTRSAPASSKLAAEALGTEPSELAFVARLLVAPRARRGGLARALLDAALSHGAHLGRAVVLDVVEDDRAAVALYDATGWRRLGQHTVMLRSGVELPVAVYGAPAR